LGSLAAAIALCIMFWSTSRAFGRPDAALAAVLGLAAAALLGWLPNGLFVRMTVMLTVLVALPFWVAGHVWSKQLPALPDEQERPDIPAQPGAPSNQRRGMRPLPYPALTLCIVEDREPTRGELRKVATRIAREAFVARAKAEFRAQRMVLRAAQAALRGLGTADP